MTDLQVSDQRVPTELGRGTSLSVIMRLQTLAQRDPHHTHPHCVEIP